MAGLCQHRYGWFQLGKDDDDNEGNYENSDEYNDDVDDEDDGDGMLLFFACGE